MITSASSSYAGHLYELYTKLKSVITYLMMKTQVVYRQLQHHCCSNCYHKSSPMYHHDKPGHYLHNLQILPLVLCSLLYIENLHKDRIMISAIGADALLIHAQLYGDRSNLQILTNATKRSNRVARTASLWWKTASLSYKNFLLARSERKRASLMNK